MHFEIYPAIDLKHGQAVRLRQGQINEATVYDPSPVNAAKRWVEQGAHWLHVVDLDGAFAGAPCNLESVRAIAQIAPTSRIQFGGGLRRIEDMAAALDAGASRLIIGTKALDGDLLAQAVASFGTECIVVGLDARNGFVSTEGWVKATDIKAVDLARQVAAQGVRTIIYTDIATDGMMAGPNFTEMAEMGQTGLQVIASGGIASLDDLARLRAIPGICGAVLGKSLYTKAIDLREAMAICR